MSTPECAEADWLEEVYRCGDSGVRASFGSDEGHARDYYGQLIQFVCSVQHPDEPAGTSRLLDVGCGAGWSTFAFAHAGYQAFGIDLNPNAFEPSPHRRCTLSEGSAIEIPYEANSFDVVVCFQCLEHVSRPRKALDEMVRVCRPGGVVTIVGPNLVSPTVGLAHGLKPSSWRSIQARRHGGMPRHPYGNTWPEILGFAMLRGQQLFSKLIRRMPQFTMRKPDHVLPFHADNDACYLCNPTDLIKYFGHRGLKIERRGKPGRPPLSYLLAGGTWVAARKPSRC